MKTNTSVASILVVSVSERRREGTLTVHREKIRRIFNPVVSISETEMLMALGKMLKSDYKQVGRAINEYKNGISVTKKDWETVNNMLGDNGQPADILENKDELMALTRGQRQALGVMNHLTQQMEEGQFTDALRFRDAMGPQGSGVYRTDHAGAVNISRQYSENSSDLTAAGRLAAAGVVGFSATAGVLNLVRGE